MCLHADQCITLCFLGDEHMPIENDGAQWFLVKATVLCHLNYSLRLDHL